jgi:hypothetical protein
MKSESERAIKLAGLRKHGFKRIGHWALDKNRQLELKTRSRPEGLAIYLFVIKGSIRYVGKSQGLHGRFGQYSRGLLKGNLKVDHVKPIKLLTNPNLKGYRTILATNLLLGRRI